MKTDLKEFVGTFDSLARIGEAIVLRFHHGYTFDLTSDNPVLLVRATGCEDIDKIEARTAGFAGEEVECLTVDQKHGRIKIAIDFCWANGGETFVLSAADVAVSYEQYTLEDYRKYIRMLEESGRRDRVAHHCLTSSIKQLREHLQAEVVRLGKKAEFFSSRDESKAACLGARLAALAEVIMQLEKCEQSPPPYGSPAAGSPSGEA